MEWPNNNSEKNEVILREDVFYGEIINIEMLENFINEFRDNMLDNMNYIRLINSPMEDATLVIQEYRYETDEEYKNRMCKIRDLVLKNQQRNKNNWEAQKRKFANARNGRK